MPFFSGADGDAPKKDNDNMTSNLQLEEHQSKKAKKPKKPRQKKEPKKEPKKKKAKKEKQQGYLDVMIANDKEADKLIKSAESEEEEGLEGQLLKLNAGITNIDLMIEGLQE